MQTPGTSRTPTLNTSVETGIRKTRRSEINRRAKTPKLRSSLPKPQALSQPMQKVDFKEGRSTQSSTNEPDEGQNGAERSKSLEHSKTSCVSKPSEQSWTRWSGGQTQFLSKLHDPVKVSIASQWGFQNLESNLGNKWLCSSGKRSIEWGSHFKSKRRKTRGLTN